MVRKTPLVPHGNLLLKLECLQVSGSFKDRGISHMISESLLVNKSLRKIVCSSGGNAGNAVAAAGSTLNVAVDVFVPTTTMPMMVAKIEKRGANVHVGGSNWNEADQRARKTLDDSTLYVPPFNDALIWEGNSYLVDEILQQVGGDISAFPQVIVLSVGGGGLLRGVQLGLERLGLVGHTEIVAVETEGAGSFAAAKANDNKVISLSAITSIASSLGALSVVESTLTSPVKTTSCLVSDAHAVLACVKFADEMRLLVEPACGASLVSLYLICVFHVFFHFFTFKSMKE